MRGRKTVSKTVPETLSQELAHERDISSTALPRLPVAKTPLNIVALTSNSGSNPMYFTYSYLLISHSSSQWGPKWPTQHYKTTN